MGLMDYIMTGYCVEKKNVSLLSFLFDDLTKSTTFVVSINVHNR